MLFGVYFVFAGLNEVIALHMERASKNMEKEQATPGENYIAAKKRFALNILIIIAILLVGAFGFMACEKEWTFIKALYFSVETITVKVHYYLLSQNSAKLLCMHMSSRRIQLDCWLR